mgnify:CR=1 FL=1
MKDKIIIAGMLFGKQYFCINCKKEVIAFKDRISAKEFAITHLCQECQDKIFV